ncbi:hypothetical protein BH11PLA2_BH11PLA2_43680 [soil metagenome]
MTPLQYFASDHEFLILEAAKAAGISDPVAVTLDVFETPLLNKATRGPLLPLANVLIRDWDRSNTKYWPGIIFGARVMRIEGITFVRVTSTFNDTIPHQACNFYLVSNTDYRTLFRIARRCLRESQPPEPPPVLTDSLLASLQQNTLGFLDADNLKRIKSLGGRPKRGLLFSGPPGNGKTSACRWILQHCLEAGHETKQVSPDDYKAARDSCNPAAAVRELFRVSGRGVVFFDDMDIALKDRAQCERPEDQAVFLGALDGITVNEGVVYIFTTNLPLDQIDAAFKRPGRLDVTLNFPKPDATLRRALIDRWHEEIRAGIDIGRAVSDCDGLSFAEIEEYKNLLVLNYLDHNVWDWAAARALYERNRNELDTSKLPFGFARVVANGKPAVEAL